jgi:hypothetical protein
MTKTPRGSARLFAAPLLSLLALLWIAVPATAAPAIEGVWSFNGGRIAVQGTDEGAFTGTVVAPTTFSLCSHPVGEEIWTKITQQPDGSFWGLHQWFFESSECVRNPDLGQSAWRVFQNASGRYLRACFSEPGSGLQPTIAADGSVTNATFECADSALVAAVPDSGSAALARGVKLPTAAGCLARRALRVRISDPVNDPIQKISVTYRSGGVTRRATVKRNPHGAVATVPLGKVATKTLTVEVSVTTVLGHHWHGSRHYRRCTKAKKRHLHVSPKPAANRPRSPAGR